MIRDKWRFDGIVVGRGLQVRHRCGIASACYSLGLSNGGLHVFFKLHELYAIPERAECEPRTAFFVYDDVGVDGIPVIYSGLRHDDHAEILPFVIGRIGIESVVYGHTYSRYIFVECRTAVIQIPLVTHLNYIRSPSVTTIGRYRIFRPFGDRVERSLLLLPLYHVGRRHHAHTISGSKHVVLTVLISHDRVMDIGVLRVKYIAPPLPGLGKHASKKISYASACLLVMLIRREAVGTVFHCHRLAVGVTRLGLIHSTAYGYHILVAVDNKHLSLERAYRIEHVEAVDLLIVDTAELHAHNILRTSAVGVKALEHHGSGIGDCQCRIDQYKRLEKVGIGSRSKTCHEPALTASEKSHAGSVDKIPSLGLTCYVLHIFLLGKHSHFGSLSITTAIIAATAEVKYITCHSAHGQSSCVVLRLIMAAVIAVGHYHQRFFGLGGIGNIRLSPYVFTVAALAVYFPDGKRVVTVREILGLHRIVGKVIEAITQKYVYISALILELPAKPRPQHAGE